MKIILIQENGRHAENQHFRECYSMQRSLQKAGHIVEIWGLGHNNFKTEPAWDSYDIIFNLENYETVEDRLKIEVENYNNLNQKKKELEVDLGKINQDMLKILGKIELLQDLTEKKENKDG